MLLCDRCKEPHNDTDFQLRVRRCCLAIDSSDQRSSETPSLKDIGTYDLCNQCKDELFAKVKALLVDFVKSTPYYCGVDRCRRRVKSYGVRCAEHSGKDPSRCSSGD